MRFYAPQCRRGLVCLPACSSGTTRPRSLHADLQPGSGAGLCLKFPTQEKDLNPGASTAHPLKLLAGAVFRTGFLHRKLVAPSISQFSEAILLQEATQHEELCEAILFEEAAQHEFVWFLGLSLCVVLSLCVCFLVRSFVCLFGWLAASKVYKVKA